MLIRMPLWGIRSDVDSPTILLYYMLLIIATVIGKEIMKNDRNLQKKVINNARRVEKSTPRGAFFNAKC